MLLFTLLLTTSAAAQDVSMLQGFAEGFTFHSHFAGNRRIDPDGAVVYWRDGGCNTHIASVRQAGAPCVFLSHSPNLNEGVGGTQVVMLEETYDLRNVSFEADRKHQFAPPGGVYPASGIKVPSTLILKIRLIFSNHDRPAWSAAQAPWLHPASQVRASNEARPGDGKEFRKDSAPSGGCVAAACAVSLRANSGAGNGAGRGRAKPCRSARKSYLPA
jgi:hypothetical protein